MKPELKVVEGATQGVPVPPTRGGVVFGVPSLSGTVTTNFLRSWTDTVMMLKERSIVSSSIQIIGDSFIAKARNRIATDFLRECPEADCLFFLDDDVDWPAEKVLEFIQRPEPVVAGIYPQKKATADFPVSLAYDTTSGELIEKDGLFRAILVPTGFLRIKRWVLEKLAEPPTRLFKDAIMNVAGQQEYGSFYGIFESGIGPVEDGDQPWWWGEDYVFSRKCQTLGIDIWVDPHITMGHVGRKRWEDSLGKNLPTYRERAKMAVEQDPVRQADGRLREALRGAVQ